MKNDPIHFQMGIIKDGVSSERLNKIRCDIRDLRNHYEQLLDLAKVLEENDNNFFAFDNLRYFRLFSNRIERLRDHTIQVRDVYKTHLDVKQNNIMTVLTVVTTIFLPLTLIVGWYGMNFKYMSELEYKISYPVLVFVNLIIILGELDFLSGRNGYKNGWIESNIIRWTY